MNEFSGFEDMVVLGNDSSASLSSASLCGFRIKPPSGPRGIPSMTATILVTLVSPLERLESLPSSHLSTSRGPEVSENTTRFSGSVASGPEDRNACCLQSAQSTRRPPAGQAPGLLRCPSSLDLCQGLQIRAPAHGQPLRSLNTGSLPMSFALACSSRSMPTCPLTSSLHLRSFVHLKLG